MRLAIGTIVCGLALCAGCASADVTADSILPPCVNAVMVGTEPMPMTNKFTGELASLYAVDITTTEFGIPTDISYKETHMGFPQLPDGPNEVTLFLPEGDNVLTGPWKPGACDNVVTVTAK